jgi:Oxidoreductase molybdopterin binding domain
MRGVKKLGEFVMAFSDGGYTANLPLEDLTGGKAWVTFAFNGAPLEPEHGGPARFLVPHLLLEERQMGARAAVDVGRRTRFLGDVRVPPKECPTTCARAIRNACNTAWQSAACPSHAAAHSEQSSRLQSCGHRPATRG